MSLRDRLFPPIGPRPLQQLEREAHLRRERAIDERLEGMTRGEQMRRARRDPELCQRLMDETTVTSSEYAKLAHWRDGG